MKFPGHAPLIGAWLYRRSVRAKARAASEGGDPAAVRELVNVLCTSGDSKARECARAALLSLTAPAAIDTFCQEAMIRHDIRLTDIASACQYAPSGDPERALFFFCTGDMDALSQIDPQPGNPLLYSGYMGATPGVQAAVRSRAKDRDCSTLFAHAMIGEGAGDRMNNRTVAEWELVMEGLITGDEWDECWRIFFSLPLPVAVSTLHRIRASGWVPPGDDRTILDILERTLPDAWTFPAPEPVLHRTLERPVCHTTSAVFSPNSHLLATAGSDGMVRIWRVPGGSLLTAWEAGTHAARALDFSPDAGGVLCLNAGGLLQCRDPLNGTLLWDTRGAPETVRCIAVAQGTGAVICGGTDGSLWVRDCRDGHTIASGNVHGSPVTHVAVSPDAGKVISADAGGAVSLSTRDGMALRHEYTVMHKGVQFLSFIGGNDRFVTVGDIPVPVIWDAATGNVITAPAGCGGNTPCTVSVYDTGIAIGRDDQTFSVWQVPSGALTSVPVYHQGIASAAATRSGTLLLAAGCRNGMLRLFRLPDGAPVKTFKAHAGLVTACCISPDGATLASCGWDGTVKLWSLPSGELMQTLRGSADEVTCLCGYPSTSSVITGNTDGTARVLDAGSGHLLRTFDLFTNAVRALAVNREGTLLACAGGDATVRIWRTADGGLEGACNGLTSTTRCLAFTPDGKVLVTGGWDGKVRFWHVPAMRLSAEPAAHHGVVIFCAVSPSGAFAVTAGGDGSIALWDPSSGKNLQSFGCGWHDLSACALAPDGCTLAIGRKDGSLSTLSLPSGGGRTEMQKVPGAVTCLAFTHDSHNVIAGYGSGSVAVFSCEGARLIRGISAHSGAVTGILPLPGEDRILTSGSDGICRIWNLPFTRKPSDTCPDDITRIAGIVNTTPAGSALCQWQFLLAFLQGRFRHEIGVSVCQPVAGAYDIQIVG